MSSNLLTSHPNVSFTHHAVERMQERGYSLDDVDAMLGSIDQRLVVQVITLLPKRCARDDQQEIDLLRRKLQHAQRTLSRCKATKSKKRWTAEVERLKHLVAEKKREQKQFRRHVRKQRMQQELRRAEDRKQLATTVEQLRKYCHQVLRVKNAIHGCDAN